MKIYAKLLPYLRPHLGLLILASGCMLASSLFEGVSLGMLVPLVDVVLNRPLNLPAWLPSLFRSRLEAFQILAPLAKLHWVVGLVVALFLLKNLTLFGQSYLMNDVAMRFLRDIRNVLYRHYQRLSMDFFSAEKTGNLVSRITHDVSVLQNTLTEGMTDLIYQSSRVAILIGILLVINWRLAAVALVLLPAIGYPMVRLGKILRKLALLVQERMADLNNRIIETCQGMRIIKAFTAEEKEAGRFAAINQGYYKANVKTVKRREALAAITDLVGLAGGLVVLEVGARAIVEKQLELGTFVLFLGALLSLLQPVKKLSRLYSINQQAVIAAKRVTEVLESEPSVTEFPFAQALPAFAREIRFEDVWFRYEDRWILKGVNLSVARGEAVAIVATSGAGKTTLVNLIPRFYDPTQGRVMIDGVDVKEVSLSSLRSQVGLVTQEPFLFHDTVRANIAFGRPDASSEEVVQAAQAANADLFIRRLPKGYDTSVGDLGGRLSGGERQRIAIARAILKDPPILILDEATSQLDSESEALVQEALERLMEGRTVFVIAHRLSTIRRVERIVVLDEGRMSQMGRHEELLAGSPVYRRLYELQVAQ